MSSTSVERVVDKEYLALLENKLQALKNPGKVTAKQFLSDIATHRDHQLFHLITAKLDPPSGFDDDFSDAVITSNYLRRLIAPHTCAINKQELLHLLKSDHVQGENEVEFAERNFLPFSESNQILIIHKDRLMSNEEVEEKSAKFHTCLINAYGRLHFVEENKVVLLPKMLAEKSLKKGHSIEHSCADVLTENDEGCLAVLATIISSTLHVEMTAKVELTAPVAHCCLSSGVFDKQTSKFWNIYESGMPLSVYKLEKRSHEVAAVDDVCSVFPELLLDEFPGAVIRSSIAHSEDLAWSALGFDTGRVYLSVYDKNSKTVHRKLIKFSGPISIVMFVPPLNTTTPEQRESEGSHSIYEQRYLVISSTLGPVTIWKCVFEGGLLSWSNEIILSQSEQFDTITSASIVGENIAIGTYSGKLLFYASPNDVISHEIASMTQIHAPIVNMKVLDENTLYVLSTAGLHTVTRSDLLSK